MARLARMCPAGIPQHVIQRGNNREICFASEQDMQAYVAWLKKYSAEFEVDIHAWVLMSNHVHMLCTPHTTTSISRMMQSLGRCYVRYFNYTYRRSGTLWEGRFKSCLVDSESYLLHLYRYIELNPVRAAMVADPADYAWSSYQCNALGKDSALCTEHAAYLSLGKTRDERLLQYRELFSSHIDGKLLDDIRKSLNSGLALGSERFIRDVEALVGRRVTAGQRGRPKREGN